MNNTKKQKDMTLKNELPQTSRCPNDTWEEWRNSSRKNEEMSQSENKTQLHMWRVMEVTSNAVKNNIA